jgi:hypothetical protein
MGQVLPMRHLARDVVRDAADREVGIGIGHHHRDIDVGVHFSCPQRRTDAGVASTDGDQSHYLSRFGAPKDGGVLCWLPLDVGEVS